MFSESYTFLFITCLAMRDDIYTAVEGAIGTVETPMAVELPNMWEWYKAELEGEV